MSDESPEIRELRSDVAKAAEKKMRLESRVNELDTKIVEAERLKGAPALPASAFIAVQAFEAFDIAIGEKRGVHAGMLVVSPAVNVKPIIDSGRWHVIVVSASDLKTLLVEGKVERGSV